MAKRQELVADWDGKVLDNQGLQLAQGGCIDHVLLTTVFDL